MSQNSTPLPAAQTANQGVHVLLGLFQGTPLQRQVPHCRCHTGLSHLVHHQHSPEQITLAQTVKSASTDAPVSLLAVHVDLTVFITN